MTDLRDHIVFGVYRKRLYLRVAGNEVWQLLKIDLLNTPPKIIFRDLRAYRGDPLNKYDWTPIPEDLGVTWHKCVLAKIISRRTVDDTIALINELAKKREEGPIMNGLLSDDHGRAYLTAPGLRWGWRLDIQTTWFVERHRLKRVHPIQESTLFFSRYGSLVIPIKSLIASVVQDFGTFADPYAMKEKKVRGRVWYTYVEIPYHQEVVHV